MKIIAAAILSFSICIAAYGPAHSDDDCVAQVPTEGILKHGALENVVKEQAEFTFIEKATLTGEPDISLNVEAGGCAHYAVTLTYIFNDDEPLENKEYYLEKAKSLLERTPFKDDALYWKAEFFLAFEKNANDAEALDSGFYVLELGYSTVYLSTDREGRNVALSLTHDIAL